MDLDDAVGAGNRLFSRRADVYRCGGSVFQLYGAAIVVGFILMVLSLGDGPHGLKVLYRDVKRHVVGP